MDFLLHFPIEFRNDADQILRGKTYMSIRFKNKIVAYSKTNKQFLDILLLREDLDENMLHFIKLAWMLF